MSALWYELGQRPILLLRRTTSLLTEALGLIKETALAKPIDVASAPVVGMGNCRYDLLSASHAQNVKMRPVASDAVWSVSVRVCLSVCWTQREPYRNG